MKKDDDSEPNKPKPEDIQRANKISQVGSNVSQVVKTSPVESEDLDDISSLCTLHEELSEYLQKAESNVYGNAYDLYPGVETIYYDFTAERQNLYATNLVESTAHYVKGCLGAGLLGIHEGYMYGGLWASLGATVILGFLVPYCTYMLIRSAQSMYGRLRVPRLSYADLAEAAVATGPLIFFRRHSKACRYFVELLLFIEFNGTCCIFEIMIANTLKQVLEIISQTAKDLNLDISIYIIIITIPLILLCLIRSLKYLAPFSLVADLFIGTCVITSLYYSLSVAASLSNVPAWKSVHGFLRFCGVCIYSIDGIGVSLPIENNMRRPQYFNVVLQCGTAIVVPLVAMVGFFGYWAWGEQCRTPITIHMPSENIPIIMQFLLTASLGVTFAVHFWVPFRVIWHYISRICKRRKNILERIFRAAHVMLLSCLAIAFPNLIKWMSFLGNFFMGLVVFILPAFIDSMVSWNQPLVHTRLRLLKNLLIMSIGVTLCGGAIYSYD
ncbi:proton-coupled amino acid transporter-like protein pathetic [Pieris napi]|uniref:proton-coupled amino acid transporter-like protein pathetic n=1 Tax=Pieris napi TaxID=78633 RepID=UPI001FBC1335|nr:proton-coupled amino acid transporter-like protein pathetic [Pieris napi]